MKVGINTVVSLRYSMKNDGGVLLEDTMDKSPIHYLHGSGSILPILESSLEGLQCGEWRFISISPETNPGLDDKFHFDIIIDKVRAATEEEIQTGKPIVSKESCGPGCCC